MRLSSSKYSRRAAAVAIAADSPARKSRNNKFKITKGEIKRRAGYIFLGIFVAYLVTPLQEFLDSVNINPWILAIIGISLTFYFFDF